MRSCAPIYRRIQPALGTWLELSVGHVSDERAHALMSEAFREAARWENVFSIFRPGSELARINAADPYERRELSPELAKCLRLGRRIETGFTRAFRLMPECRHPGECYLLEDAAVTRFASCRFDLGGIAKGYIVDRLFEWLCDRAEGGIAVNAGGDLRCSDSRTVEVRVPGAEGERRYALQVESGAIATSSLGGSDGGTGEPCARYVRGEGSIRTVAVVAESCAAADALTKVALFGDLSPEAGQALRVRNVFRFDARGKELFV